jgi:hypothetical protein
VKRHLSTALQPVSVFDDVGRVRIDAVAQLVVDVSHSQYWIAADGSADEPTVDVMNGLLAWHPRLCRVTVAAEFKVRLAVELSSEEPALALDDWQDVVEWSMTTSEGLLFVTPLFAEPRRPNLAGGRPGTYRLRLSATARDQPNRAGRIPEEHRLQVWPTPFAQPSVLKSTSRFGEAWGRPEPRRRIDWDRLAACPGTRLVVHWWQLRPPSEDAGRTVTVEVAGDIAGGPKRAYNLLRAGGGVAMGATTEGARTYLSVNDVDDVNQAPLHMGRLDLVIEQLESEPNTHVRYTWGFQESQGVPGAVLHGPHPIPPDSTVVDVRFSRGREGRQVLIRHHEVPAWLARDVQAWWQLVLTRNQVSDYWTPWPWSVAVG